MKLSVALCFAGVFAALGAAFIFLSFGTDYWVLASPTCVPKDEESKDSLTITLAVDLVHDQSDGSILIHSGFFWSCFFGILPDEFLNETLRETLSDKSSVKVCFPGYLSTFPELGPTNNTTKSKTAIIYGGFWRVFMLISVAAVTIGGFLIICAAPFASHCLYKAGGGLFLTSGFFMLCAVVMHVVWLQVLDVVQTFVNKQRASLCPDFTLNLSYGLSFVFAPIGIFFTLLAGLLFLLIGRTVKIHH